MQLTYVRVINYLKIYHLNSFQDFTKVVFVVNMCLVILSEIVSLVAEHHLTFINFYQLLWELNILVLILFCEPPQKG